MFRDRYTARGGTDWTCKTGYDRLSQVQSWRFSQVSRTNHTQFFNQTLLDFNWKLRTIRNRIFSNILFPSQLKVQHFTIIVIKTQTLFLTIFLPFFRSVQYKPCYIKLSLLDRRLLAVLCTLPFLLLVIIILAITLTRGKI